MRNYLAEFFGTFWLVFGGCGSALFAAGIPGLGIGYAGVALAFGLTVVTMAYGVGHISGGHFNPAVSFGLVAAGRFPARQLIPYIISQVLGAVAAAAVLYLIVSNNTTTPFAIDNTKAGAFAANGYGDLSPHGYTLIAAFVAEFVLTAFFLIVICGASDKFSSKGFTGLAIGLCLTLIHLISIPITNTSVNPARSTSQALFAGGAYLPQLWLFWVAPIAGGIVGGLIYKYLLELSPDGQAN
ncbi:aquaporin Z [Chitinophaga costaii]|uniref:Aquaporin Z n=1 Tax=Chitinophaga costaii TaxID=1335309 RepID=A0A1C4DUK9_9BACT|nr:aquaporin Z [Chitinophaga costaii]PUZ27802.1 aquaporin Z [Chitinophaga costaii]SCC35037.1 aquaporin Z [Chitinophaga costaii]